MVSLSLSRQELTAPAEFKERPAGPGLGMLLAGAGLAAILARRPSRVRHHPEPYPLPTASPRRETGDETAVTAARRLNTASGVLAFSVLTDSAMEHYRGSFHNPAMYIPLVVSSLTLLCSGHGVSDRRPGAHRLRDFIFSAAAITGLTGSGFHLYNLTKRPGGFSWENLFYAAPLGAPSAILLSGLLGFMSERIRDAERGRPIRFLGLPAGRLTAAITALGLLGTAGEAGLLHFRGAYHDPFMFIPVTIPPAASALMGEAALGPSGRTRTLTRWWLRLTAAIGFLGAVLHAYGVHRNMGGWRNWRQNLFNGPPLPAPPSFTGLALAGLSALALREDRPNA